MNDARHIVHMGLCQLINSCLSADEGHSGEMSCIIQPLLREYSSKATTDPRNIPVEQHNKHLNLELVKTAVSHVGANISTASILQCGKSLKCLVSLLQNFDEQHGVPPPSSAHTQASLAKDKSAILEDAVRHSSNIFSGTGLANHGIFIIQPSTFTLEFRLSPSSDLISQNCLGRRAKESAQRYQTPFSVAILLAEMAGWERDYLFIV